MTHELEQEYKAAIREAAQKIQELLEENAQLKKQEPIAVIGMGCRFPGGGNTPEAFWHILEQGIDAVSEIPAQRWPADDYYDPDGQVAGKMYTKEGAFLDHIENFDAPFFEIAPKEAESLDPQQRLLLEVSWEALESAGLEIPELRGSQTGVFMGISARDYVNAHLYSGKADSISTYSLTGVAFGTAVGRMSYFFDFRGPSIPVDTACSSSLVALHLAVHSLNSHETDLALAGGVNLLVTPELFIGFCKFQALASDGRCKTFDASANGFGRGEGCGVVVLKRLSDAIRDGDPILAVVRGTAVNNDGKSNGLTAPNEMAQVDVIKTALERAQLSPKAIDYIEAHGTGTKLGDPIEIEALGKVFKQRVDPLLIGSVKSNVAHLESAAGVAGLIKVILALQHRQIPESLHFKRPNPYIPWETAPVSVVDRLTPWESNGKPRAAGISSFGFSGTNAHIIVQEAPEDCRLMIDDCRLEDFKRANNQQSTINNHQSLHLLTLSAKTQDALKPLAEQYKKYLSSSTANIADICYTSNISRSWFPYRLPLVGSSKEDFIDALSAAPSETEDPSPEQSSKHQTPNTKHQTPNRRVAFLFTGQGSQYIEMGRELYESQPTFRKTIDQCNEILRPYLESPLLSVLYPGIPDAPNTKHQTLNTKHQTPLINQTAYTQPALFAIEYALAEVWKSWGIVPKVVMGHSLGEYAAACMAGVFSLEDGLRLIAERGRLMQALPRNGEMIAVRAEKNRVTEAIQEYAFQVSIAAINGPESCVISGEREALAAVVEFLQAEGIKTKRIEVSHAFHSPLMEPMLESFSAVASGITYARPHIKFISNLTGGPVSSEIATPEYWVEHIRQPVKFLSGMETLFKQEYEIFLEIGPKPILSGLGRQITEEQKMRRAEGSDQSSLSNPQSSIFPSTGSGHRNLQSSILWLPSLRQGQSDWQQMLGSLGELYRRGVAVDWHGFHQDSSSHKVLLPTYPFQRQRYWLDPHKKAHNTGLLSYYGAAEVSVAPLSGISLFLPGSNQIRRETQISQESPAFLKDHRVFDVTVVPATAYLQIVLAAATEQFKTSQLVLEDFSIQRALILPDNEAKMIHVVLSPETSLKYRFELYSLNPADDSSAAPSWKLHATGRVLRLEEKEMADSISGTTLQTLQKDFTQQIAVEEFYQSFEARGIDYGPTFRTITALWSRENQGLAQIELPETLLSQASEYEFHPVLFDACLHALKAALPDNLSSSLNAYLPVGIEHLQLYRQAGSHVWAYVQMSADNGVEKGTTDKTLRVEEICVFAPQGQIVARLKGLQLRKVSRQALMSRDREGWKDWLYEVTWRPQMLVEQDRTGDWLISPQEVKDKLFPQIQELIRQDDIDVYEQIMEELDALSLSYIIQAFKQSGLSFQLHSRFFPGTVREELGIVDLHRQLFGRFLEMLAEDGVLKSTQHQWEVIKSPEISDPQSLMQTTLSRYSSAEAIITLMDRCGTELGNVLQGKCDPLQLLFPDGDLSLLEKIYQEFPHAQNVNTLVQKVVSTALEHLSPTTKVRLLEIGAGTGGTTSYILPHLPSAQTEYVFTDVAPLFTMKAQEKFQKYPFVRYEILDIETAPDLQGFEDQSYDIVIAANVLHATSNLSRTLQHVRQLLASGGILLLLEGTKPYRWLDLTFGLTEGWWKFSDKELRPAHPLIPASQWRQILQTNGFTAVSIVARDEDTFTTNHQAIILAQTGDSNPEKVAPEPEQWLIFNDQQGIGEALAELLMAKGYLTYLVHSGEAYEKVSKQEFKVNPFDAENFRKLLENTLLQHIQEDRSPQQKIVYLWGLETKETATMNITDLELSSKALCMGSLHLIQAVLNTRWTEIPSLWLITRGVQPIGDNPLIPGTARAALWGLGRTLIAEQPAFKCTLVDLAPQTSVDDAETILAEILRSGPGENQIAYREHNRYVARLSRYESVPTEEEELNHFREDASYLIVGGLGGLGLETARWMVDHGARQLVLTGRRGMTDAARQPVETLKQAGAYLKIIPADVSDANQVARMFREIQENMPVLGGIIHAAGVLEDHLLTAQTWESFEKVLRPKVQGAWNLHQASQNLPLDFFVMFSSIVSLFGSPGQANHAAANAFLDSLAWYRRSQGLPGISINWGAWTETGTVSGIDVEKELEKKGLGGIGTELGLEVLNYIFLQAPAQVGVTPVDWNLFSQLWNGSQFFEDVLLSSEYVREKEERKNFRQQLKNTPVAQQQTVLQTHVRSQVAKVLGIRTPDSINLQQEFWNMGMDSLTSLEFCNRLQTSLQCPVPATVVFDYPNITTLADYLSREVLAPGVLSQPVAPFRKIQSEQERDFSHIEELPEEDIDLLLDDKLTDIEAMLSRKRKT